MKRILFVIFIIGIYFHSVQAQESSQLLITIGEEKIDKNEFLRVFKKNNGPEALERKTIDEYLDLFINYKLKVIEAKKLGFDTLTTFKNELLSYRSQLAKPYLVDKKMDKALLQEAFERKQEDIHVSHILLKIPINATPDDTTRLYRKALLIRSRIVDNGENFETVAKGTSEDPSVKYNAGNLGYFTVFQMVYPFESAAYKTPVGSISMPVRSRFGYHIIKVHDRRKAMGKIKVAHIMLATPKGSTEKQKDEVKVKISNIYSQILNGTDFTYAAKQFSQDRGSANKGGELPWFGTGRMVPSFEKAAFALKVKNDISKPIQTTYGWHIIKLIDKKGLPTLDEIKGELTNKIASDSRSHKSKKSFINRLKTEYSSVIDTTVLKKMLDVVNTDVFEAKWLPTKGEWGTYNFLSFHDQKRSLNDFANYLQKWQRKEKPSNLWIYLLNRADEFQAQELSEIENSKLEDKFTDFRYLMKEYHDGILLFDITDKLVWSKAANDSLGLKQYYNENRSAYKWNKRMYATIFTVPDMSQMAKFRKYLNKKIGNTNAYQSILKKLNKNITDSLHIKMENRIWEETEAMDVPVIMKWENDFVTEYSENDKNYVVVVDKITEGELKEFDQCKGLVISNYQTSLEQNWIKQLKEKYKIEVNSDLLNLLKEN